MNKTFRLHRQHDMDLIALYRNKDFNFTKELKAILIAYANNYPYTPPPFEDEFTEGYVGCSITFHISLSPKKAEEKKVLDLLNDIKYGYGNSFIKALFRSYMPLLPLSAFSKNNGFVTSRRAFAPRVVENERTERTDTKETLSTVEIGQNNNAVIESNTMEEDPVEEKSAAKKSPITEDLATTKNPLTTETPVTEKPFESETVKTEPLGTDGFDMSSFMAGLGNLSHNR